MEAGNESCGQDSLEAVHCQHDQHSTAPYQSAHCALQQQVDAPHVGHKAADEAEGRVADEDQGGQHGCLVQAEAFVDGIAGEVVDKGSDVKPQQEGAQTEEGKLCMLKQGEVYNIFQACWAASSCLTLLILPSSTF